MTTITNVSPGPRGVNTTEGTVVLDPGQSVDADLEAAEMKVAKGTGWFKFGKVEEPPADETDEQRVKREAAEKAEQAEKEAAARKAGAPSKG